MSQGKVRLVQVGCDQVGEVRGSWGTSHIGSGGVEGGGVRGRSAKKDERVERDGVRRHNTRDLSMWIGRRRRGATRVGVGCD